jgi:hypothetical protein
LKRERDLSLGRPLRLQRAAPLTCRYRPDVGRFALGAALAIACVALPAAAAPTMLRNASWADNRHGWIDCHGGGVCATEDGGRSWRQIFTGGNYIFALVRTSVTAGMTETGNTAGFSFWTRDNGVRWYELPNVPTPTGSERGLVFEGRGNLLFWHQSGTTLFQLTPWPATADPPCKGQSWPGPGTCVLAEADSPFTSTAVETIPTGTLDRMRNIPGGVAVLVTATDPNASPGGVLVHRGDTNSVSTLPEPPLERRSLTCTGFYAAWPALFVEASSFSAGPGCAKLPRVLWRSADGGDTWTVASTTHVGARAVAARRGALGRRIAVPGGTIAPYRAAPARLEISQLATQKLRLPAGARCRVATIVVAWPAILVTGRRAAGAGTIRWWSNDGGSSWSVFGRC